MKPSKAQELAAQLDKEQVDTVRRDVMNHEAAALLRAQDALLRQALAVAEKFRAKVHNGRARSVETYDDMTALSKAIKEHMK